ncbi:MAG TPA: hypothetical protein VNT79_05925 [Phycisphaerae bacterium]|nr:hypothetical protein [Phycisphaerae bacterium]
MSNDLLFWYDFNSPEAHAKFPQRPATDLEQQAVDRVRRAGVRAPSSVILSFVRSSGPDKILAAKLCDIRAIANAF